MGFRALVANADCDMRYEGLGFSVEGLGFRV